MRKLFPYLCFFSLFCLWEYALSQPLSFLLPPPSALFARLYESPSFFVYHSFVTFRGMLISFIIALSLALPTSYLFLVSRDFKHLFHPLLILSQCLPMFTLAPLLILCFGWSQIAILIPTTLSIFFPLTLNLYQGLKAVPKDFIELFQLYKASPWQIFIKLRLPWALPFLCTGIRLSAALAGVAAISGEAAGAQEGLGMLLQESRRNFDMAEHFVGFFCLGSITFLFYSGAIILEKLIYNFGSITRFFKQHFGISCCILLLCSPLSLASKQTSLLLDWLPNPNHIPLYAGIEKGFFQEEKIDLKILKISNLSDTIMHLSRGKVDFAIYYPLLALQAHAKGASFAFLGSLFSHSLSSLLCHTNSHIASIEDLQGKKIASSSGTLNAKILSSILESKAIYPHSLHKLHFDLMGSFLTEKVDVILAYDNIEGTHLQELGLLSCSIPLKDFPEIPSYPELVILMRPSLIADTTTQKHFYRALIKSLDFCRSHPQEAFELYAKQHPSKGKKTLLWERKAWEKSLPLLSNNPLLHRQDVQAWQDWLHEQDLITHKKELPFIFS